MKNLKNINIACLLLGILFFSTTFQLMAQSEDLDFRFYLSTKKNPDMSRSLVVDFYGLEDKEKLPVYQSEINYYNVLDEEEILLGSALTNNEGIATLNLSADQEFLADEEGYVRFVARFDGSEGIDAQEEEVMVMDLTITMELVENNRTVNVTATAVDGMGEEFPVGDIDIYFYVQGMLSRLRIEEGWLDEGEYSFDFPENLPGDAEGNLTIYAAIEDSDEFGNVIIRQDAKWGVGGKVEVAGEHELWSQGAPIWMAVTLTIFLIGVWANYIYTIFNLVKLKNDVPEN